MSEHAEFKQLISIYLDGETTPEQTKQVEAHLNECADCKKYWQDMSKLSSSLTSWPDEDLSPDLEQKIKNVKSREGITMKRKSSLIAVSMMFVVLIGFLSVQMYAKRSIQARCRVPTEIVRGPTTTRAYPTKGDGMVVDELGQQLAYVGKDEKSKEAVRSKFLASESPSVMHQKRIHAESEYWRDSSSVTLSGASRIGDYETKAYAPGIMLMEDIGMDYEAPEEITITRRLPYSGKFNTEQYDRIYENEFLEVTENPLSTFSIDVDTASYSNIRRFLNNGQLPPKDAVRIEEMVNYFVYDYPQPQGGQPFSITTEVSGCPWNPTHQLAMIGLQGKELTAENTPPSNLVFLIDVSGSMNNPNKLPLLKSAFRLLVNQLRPEERIAIVTYAGAAGLVLDSTPGYEKEKILQALDRLQAGGSTAGGAGIKLAYNVAKENFIANGNNRVILATDGDFNIGVSSDGELTRIIEKKREEGVFLTVLGFGTGNYKDSKMEKLADKGNGNYYYLDTLNEAQKVLVQELGAMLFAIAKDVKIQIEFNPAQVKAYRLIGYENRILAKEDFNDDTKDAGELGAGHTVTAFYEIVPAGSQEEFADVDPLVYQKKVVQPSRDVMTVKLRYKRPQESTSRLITKGVRYADVKNQNVSDNFKFASAVAEFGLLLRDSKYKGNASYLHITQQVRQAQGQDRWGYRAELIKLVEKAGLLQPRTNDSGSYSTK